MPVSTSAFKFNLRRYITGGATFFGKTAALLNMVGRCKLTLSNPR
jgi:hypothetical protein